MVPTLAENSKFTCNCAYIWSQDQSVVSHFINGQGNRNVTLYTIDALLVPRVVLRTLAGTSMCNL